tara:strand:+ start:74 stop:568 length:495 start_codon:yes stop_codon:yes gene_type:complete
MSIIHDPNNPRTVQLTGKDLESYLNNRKPIIEAEEQEEEQEDNTEEQVEKIIDFLDSSEGFEDVTQYLSEFDYEEIKNFDDLYFKLDGSGFFDENRDIIYYHKAIKYLQENDPSLCEAFEIADEMGYEVKNLNSELLATLLYQRNFRNDFCDLEEDFNDFIKSI